MARIVVALAAGAAVCTAALPALAADWGTGEPIFKQAYAIDHEPATPLTFEAGLRYFYGQGSHRADFGGGETHEADDSSHFVELHGRIDDAVTKTYLLGNLGYAAIIDGTYSGPTGGEQETSSGRIAYGSADFGYIPYQTEPLAIGGFVGYQYLNESIDMGRSEFYTSSGGGDSEPNMLEVHGLRLGITGQARINDIFDIRVDAAAIPYAALNGTYGAFGPGVNGTDPGQGSAATITGHLYGGSLEAMVGVQATENIMIRAGARGYYLTGPTETYYERRDADGDNAQGFVREGEIELMRWGPVIELTGTF
ncbi:hypothetical protein [Pelagibacterium montanilacus]|uniref:hypothetical protein n=1 Tax=Pelagibacterium montanilacus TaxID=2185280 RepID=UPI000F8F3B40|nr:hypothetical protein [Pelagibacterium montanilacus]